MLRWLMHRGVRAFERQWHYDAAYLHELIDVDPRAAWVFQRATALGRYRRGIPADALAAAGITAVRSEDCGPCTQLGVSMAEAAGVDPAVLRAVLRADPTAMPDHVALVWRFTCATLAHDPAADGFRDEIERRWGRQAVVSLAFNGLVVGLVRARGCELNQAVAGGALHRGDGVVAVGGLVEGGAHRALGGGGLHGQCPALKETQGRPKFP